MERYFRDLKICSKNFAENCILIRDTIVLSSFLEREAEMALVHQKLICSIPE